jgi:hypothetical protein
MCECQVGVGAGPPRAGVVPRGPRNGRGVSVAPSNCGRPNNGMKLTARGASDGARQLIPVFDGPEGA